MEHQQQRLDALKQQVAVLLENQEKQLLDAVLDKIASYENTLNKDDKGVG
jgi:phage shock protein A